ncbi:MAG: hypothetical protein IJW30_06440 [Clostridia bacterium]|nr:hypothetical protein [Clostridia bacterium]MBQ9774286.1 hypothetical protein [Clostridia bacterium]
MKRILTLMLALMLSLTCVLTLASCALFQKKPEMDLEVAAENLEDADYYVSYEDDEDNLEVGVEATLYAYDEDGENYLRMVTYIETSSAKIAYDALKKEYDAEIDMIKLEIKRIEDILENYEDDLEDEEVDEYEDELKECEKELEEMEEEHKMGRSGKTVWMATVDAIEDSKG